MITFQRILFPVDFSKQDHEAAPFVKAMAERFHSEVILLHAAEFFPMGYGTPDAIVLEPMVNLESLMNSRREQLNQHLSADLTGLCVRRTIELGDPAKEIAKYAHDQKVDLVMMPTHGYGPFRRFLLGSVTAKGSACHGSSGLDGGSHGSTMVSESLPLAPVSMRRGCRSKRCAATPMGGSVFHRTES